ncbi:MAG: glycosyltransferase [Selenomonadales bacterium]|nr:glycosyltransferase [Selenomonadales bacterium]
MTPLISIIIPIYNVEKYLPTCLDSILAQTYTNLEIILVDDGSPDGSGTICDEYASRDSRFVVIHQKNGGVSVARNAGLDHATGNYIGFVDPDDWIEPSMYETMMTSVLKEGCDGAVCSTLLEYRSHTKVCERFDYHIGHQPELTRGILEEKLRTLLWRTLIKKSVWDTVRFTPQTRASEDFEVFPRLFYGCTSLVFLPDLFYHWRMRSDSITHTEASLAHRVQNFRIFRSRLRFCEEHFPPSIPHVSRRTASRALNALRYLINEEKEDTPEAQELIAFLRDERPRFSPHLRLKEKFHLFTYFSARPIFMLYNRLFFWNRARVMKHKQKNTHA